MKIKVLSMDWMKKFKCIGGDCPMTCCCTNWSIGVNDDEIEKYEKMEDSFRENILAAIDEEKKCMKEKEGECKLLTEEGWCQIVQNCGEKYLPHVCKQFPREGKDFGDVAERTVGIACPVVAEYLFDKTPIEFYCDKVEKVEHEVESIDYEMYDALAMSRAYLVELLQSYENYFCTGKLYIILSLLYKTKDLIKQKGLNKEKMLQKLEFYDSQQVRVTIFEKGEEIECDYKGKARVIQKLLPRLVESYEVFQKKGFIKDEKLEKNMLIWKDNIEELSLDLEGFSKYFRKNYASIFQNYFVYAVFGNWVTMEEETFGHSFVDKIIQFTLMQLWAMAVWKEKETIDKEEYIDIIVRCDRGLGHIKEFRRKINKCFNVNNLDNTGSLLMLLIV